MPARDRTERKHTKREHNEVRQPPGKWSKVGGVVKNSELRRGWDWQHRGRDVGIDGNVDEEEGAYCLGSTTNRFHRVSFSSIFIRHLKAIGVENRPVNRIQCSRRRSGVTYRLPQLRRPSIVQVAETAADQIAAPVSCPLLHRDLPLVASGSIHHCGRRRMPGYRRDGQRRALPSVRRQKSGAPVCPAVHHPLRYAYPQRTVDARVMHCFPVLNGFSRRRASVRRY